MPPFIHAYITDYTARVSSHALRRHVDKRSVERKSVNCLRTRVPGQDPQDRARFCLDIVGLEICAWSSPLYLRSSYFLCVYPFVFFFFPLCFQSRSYGKFHLPCCTEENNVLLCMLEPKGNNHFFVKNDRISWGGSVGRAEVTVNIYFRDAYVGCPYDTHSPGLYISDMLLRRGRQWRGTSTLILCTVLSCLEVPSVRQAGGAQAGSLGMTIQDFGSKETNLTFVLFCLI